MSLRSKFISVITLAAGIVVFSTGAFAQDDKTTTPTAPAAPQKAEKHLKGEGHKFGMHKEGREGLMGRHGGREGRMGGGMFDVKLTDAQKEQIRSIREANRPDKATMEEIRTIAKARHDGTITAEQQERLKTLRTATRTKGSSVREQIQNILTAEQKAQIQQKQQEMKQKFQEHRKDRKDKPAATDKPKIN